MYKLLSFALMLGWAGVAIADEDHATLAEIDGYVAKAPAYRKAGAPITGRFDAPPQTAIQIKKGSCYAFVVHLGSDAKWKDGSPSLQLDHWPDDGNNVPMSVGPKLAGAQGAVMVPSCPSEDDSVTFGLAKWNGQGSYSVQVFERRGSAKELTAQAQKTHAFRASEARDKTARHAKQCRQCAGESLSQHDREVCLTRNGLALSDCGW
jgi:hypothetical protein